MKNRYFLLPILVGGACAASGSTAPAGSVDPAYSAHWPEWRADSEFRAIRTQSLSKRSTAP
jgi:hypothetical protein